MVRVVTPAEIAVELLYRHELDGVDAECLQIIQLSLGSCQILGLGEVAQQQLVNHKVVLVFNLEVFVFPVVFRSVDLECRNKCFCSFRERRATGDVLIIPLVIYNFGIRVAETQIAVCISTHAILEPVLFVRVETAQGNPPAVRILVALHRSLRYALPVVPVTDYVAIAGVSPVV